MTQPHVDEPLGLAVHSLPDPRDLADSQSTLRGRWKLIAIMVVCSLPVAAAYFAYFVIQPQGRAALGVLVQPLRPVGALMATSLDGAPLALATLKGQWLLVGVGDPWCAQDCRQRFFLQQQLREMLGKDKDRVDSVWLVQGEEPLAPNLRSNLQGATVLRVTPEVLAQWTSTPAGARPGDHIFVVDPLGNTMMRLPSRFDGVQAGQARRDLTRLLRASLSWDPPGRPTP